MSARFEFARPRARVALADGLVPMINVVFLLLIFFVMSARLAPPPPVDLRLPVVAGAERGPELGPERSAAEAKALFVTAEGQVVFAGAAGPAAWAQLEAHLGAGGALVLRADAAAPAQHVAEVLARLAGLGLAKVRLVVVPR